MLGNVLSTCYLLCLFGRSSGGTVHPFCGLFRFIRLSAFLLIQSLRLQCGKKREKIALLGDELWHAMYYAHTNKYGESNVVWTASVKEVSVQRWNRDASAVVPVHTAHPLPPPLICTFSTSHICAAHTRLPAHALTTLDTHFPLPLPARTVSLV